MSLSKNYPDITESTNKTPVRNNLTGVFAWIRFSIHKKCCVLFLYYFHYQSVVTDFACAFRRPTSTVLTLLSPFTFAQSNS